MTETKTTPDPPAEAVPERRVPCEVYSRIVGYLRPINSWNLAKQQEFRERVDYKPPKEV